jgi:hypothetical protein
MNRRLFICAALAGAVQGEYPPLVLPVQLITDTRAKLTDAHLRRFSKIWAEATRDLGRCGIGILTTRTAAEVRRTPSGAPIFTRLAPNKINMVITDRIPTQWDSGRGLSGVTTRYQGFHLCVVALDHAHGHQIPLFSVNTCLHELLHVLLQDVYEGRPKGMAGEARELRVDLLATRLWLFQDGAAIRSAAELYVQRLRASR